MGAAKGGQDGGGCGGEVVVEAGDHDQVCLVQPGEGAVGEKSESAAHRDGGGVRGDSAQDEGGGATVGAVGAPDLGDDGDVEGTDAREGDQRHAVRALFRGVVPAVLRAGRRAV